MALTKAHSDLISKMVVGNITVREALDESGLKIEDVARELKVPVSEIEAKLDTKIKALPVGLKLKLSTAALKLGVKAK